MNYNTNYNTGFRVEGFGVAGVEPLGASPRREQHHLNRIPLPLNAGIL